MKALQLRQHSRRARLVAAILVSGVACVTEPSTPPLEEQIFGTWDWVRTEEGGSSDVQTPEGAGFRRRLVITPTRLEVLRDGDVEESARYTFVSGLDLDDEFIPPRLVYDEVILGVMEHGVGFDGARLVLFSPCCNGHTHVWDPVPTN